mmetsp:Transcript_33388/g.70183  ORF Transcript_33388/g.70183 Transcript_33388/m.70183 type:complete len:100 (-) Transcript_33388:425-724(-)
MLWHHLRCQQQHWWIFLLSRFWTRSDIHLCHQQLRIRIRIDESHREVQFLEAGGIRDEVSDANNWVREGKNRRSERIIAFYSIGTTMGVNKGTTGGVPT